jgi:hypothetical protein
VAAHKEREAGLLSEIERLRRTGGMVSLADMQSRPAVVLRGVTASPPPPSMSNPPQQQQGPSLGVAARQTVGNWVSAFRSAMS